MFTLPFNSHYFHLSCLLTKAASFFNAFFIKAPLRHPWKQSPPPGKEKGCRQPKKGSHRAQFPSVLLAPLSISSFLSVSLCLSLSLSLFLPVPSRPFCFHPAKGSRTNLAHPTPEGGSSEEHKAIGISRGGKQFEKKY